MMSTEGLPKVHPLDCPHTNWLVTDQCVVGFGYCPDCKQQLPQTTLFNNLKAQMLAAMDTVRSNLHVSKPLPHHMAVPLHDGVRLNQDYWNGYIDGLLGAANEVERHHTPGYQVDQKVQAKRSANVLRQIARDLEDAR